MLPLVGKFELGGAPLFVAELGIAHQGRPEAAFKAVARARMAGAGAVKFQHHIPEEEMESGHPWWQTVSQASLPIETLAALGRHAQSLGMASICTPFSPVAVEQMQKFQHAFDALKIGSAELQDDQFLAAVERLWKPLHKPIIVSEGFQPLTKAQYTALGGASQVVLLGCTSRYPAQPENCEPSAASGRRYALLDDELLLKKPFYWGYSLHSHWAVGVVACGLGADLVEAHFWPQKGDNIPDNKVNLDPYEFHCLVTAGMVASRCTLGFDRQTTADPQVVALCERNADGRRAAPSVEAPPCDVLPFAPRPEPTTES